MPQHVDPLLGEGSSCNMQFYAQCLPDDKHSTDAILSNRVPSRNVKETAPLSKKVQ